LPSPRAKAHYLQLCRNNGLLARFRSFQRGPMSHSRSEAEAPTTVGHQLFFFFDLLSMTWDSPLLSGGFPLFPPLQTACLFSRYSVFAFILNLSLVRSREFTPLNLGNRTSSYSGHEFFPFLVLRERTEFRRLPGVRCDNRSRDSLFFFLPF